MTYESENELRDNLRRLQTRLDNLVALCESAKNSVFQSIADEDADVDDEVVKNLADIFGWELETEMEVEIVAKFTATFTVPVGKNLDTICDDLYGSIEMSGSRSNDGYELSVSDTDITINHI